MWKKLQLTSIALLGATRITLTPLPRKRPCHPSVFMTLWKTPTTEWCPFPTMRWVRMVSSGATVVLDTAPATAPLNSLRRDAFAIFSLKPLICSFCRNWRGISTTLNISSLPLSSVARPRPSLQERRKTPKALISLLIFVTFRFLFLILPSCCSPPSALKWEGKLTWLHLQRVSEPSRKRSAAHRRRQEENQLHDVAPGCCCCGLWLLRRKPAEWTLAPLPTYVWELLSAAAALLSLPLLLPASRCLQLRPSTCSAPPFLLLLFFPLCVSVSVFDFSFSCFFLSPFRRPLLVLQDFLCLFQSNPDSPECLTLD